MAPGDRLPNLILPDRDGRVRNFYVALRGLPIVLAVITDPGDTAQRELLASIDDKSAALTAAGADLFTVAGGGAASMPEVAHTVMFDTDWRIIPHLLKQRSGTSATAFAPYRTFVLDPNQRILAIIEPDATDPMGEVRAAIESWHAAKSAPQVLSAGAPVLLLPDVFDAALCAELIGLWHTGGHVEGGNAGTYGDEIRQDKKRTRDHIITDQALHDRICEIFMRRITPELVKVFRDTIGGYYFDRHVIISYQAGRDDFFGLHRDNFSPETRSRTYAVSLNLNEDYEGGELRFPEYGPHLYKPATGAACVFSCSLLHEALPVTGGQRWALTSFFWR